MVACFVYKLEQNNATMLFTRREKATIVPEMAPKKLVLVTFDVNHSLQPVVLWLIRLLVGGLPAFARVNHQKEELRENSGRRTLSGKP